jgi:hypothetical protein
MGMFLFHRFSELPLLRATGGLHWRSASVILHNSALASALVDPLGVRDKLSALLQSSVRMKNKRE